MDRIAVLPAMLSLVLFSHTLISFRWFARRYGGTLESCTWRCIDNKRACPLHARRAPALTSPSRCCHCCLLSRMTRNTLPPIGGTNLHLIYARTRGDELSSGSETHATQGVQVSTGSCAMSSHHPWSPSPAAPSSISSTSRARCSSRSVSVRAAGTRRHPSAPD